MTRKNLANDLIGITSRLIALMSQEIESLRARRPREIEALQEEKASLARAYETLVKELAREPETLAGLAPALRAELKAKTAEFQKTLAENEARLRAAKEVNARVLRAIADAVAESQKRAGYSKSGASGEASKGAGPAGPVALDRTL